MNDVAGGLIVSPDGRPKEGFDDPAKGSAYWFTLFSGDRTPTHAMSAGVMVLPPNGGRLEPHRHSQAEIYFVAEGDGTLTIHSADHVISAGAAAFIPGDALHALRNDGPDELRVFYVFPADAFPEVVYRFERD